MSTNDDLRTLAHFLLDTWYNEESGVCEYCERDVVEGPVHEQNCPVLIARKYFAD